MFELMDTTNQNAVIKVIGVGCGGGNAVRHMASCGIEGVEFICANTDAQALRSASVRTALQIGCNITKGLGLGIAGQVAGVFDGQVGHGVFPGVEGWWIKVPAWVRGGAVPPGGWHCPRTPTGAGGWVRPSQPPERRPR